MHNTEPTFPAVDEQLLREQMCDIGRRIWQRGYCAGNEGNHSVRVGANRILCTPTGLSKGQLRPEEICVVDMEARQLEGPRKCTSEIYLHLAVYRDRDDVRAVVHSHPPHVTAFAVSGVDLPTGVHPEAELFLGAVKTAPYVTAGDQRLGDSIRPLLPGASSIILQNHGVVCLDSTLETCYYRLEVIEAYARLLLLAKEVGSIRTLDDAEMAELLALRPRFGQAPDPRLRDGEFIGERPREFLIRVGEGPRAPDAEPSGSTRARGGAEKSLDAKLARIHADPHGSPDFILADAKDADMALGVATAGKCPLTGRMRSLADYRDQVREITRQGLVDIMLMSASTSELITICERLFDGSPVTPAVRANDTTDIHLQRGSSYSRQPSRPFRTPTIDQIQSGRVNPTPQERGLGSDLGLYSMTLNNRMDFDHATLEAYRDFRIEAETRGFRHFLEIFDPNAGHAVKPKDVARFINDTVARTLAGVPTPGRPLFLKIPFHGRAAVQELIAYDPHLVVGIMGGSAGTTFDAFKLLEDARAAGVRAALFGRKINTAAHQLTFVRFLRLIADGAITAKEAVRAYHDELQKLKIKPIRPLTRDLKPTRGASAYAAGREEFL